MKHVEKIRVYPSKTAWTLNSEEIWGYMLEPAGSSIKQQYRTAFCALKHTRSSYKPAIYMDSGLSFDASSEVFERRTWPLQLEVVRLGVGAAVFGRRE